MDSDSLLCTRITLCSRNDYLGNYVQKSGYLQHRYRSLYLLALFTMGYQTFLESICRLIKNQTLVDSQHAAIGRCRTGRNRCGVARALKKHNPDVHIVAVEPASSPILAGGQAASHRIQGIGANFIPKLYDASVVDEVIGVPDDEAIRAGRELAATEGLLAGISSGAAVYAARQLAQRPEFRNKKIVALLPDTGERYLSTELFAFDAYPLD